MLQFHLQLNPKHVLTVELLVEGLANRLKLDDLFSERALH
jgi:hypothetical protein